jgi:hypothetical protein
MMVVFVTLLKTLNLIRSEDFQLAKRMRDERTVLRSVLQSLRECTWAPNFVQTGRPTLPFLPAKNLPIFSKLDTLFQRRLSRRET